MFYFLKKYPSHKKDIELWKVNLFIYLFFYDNFVVL